MSDLATRQLLVDVMIEAERRNLNRGTSGNASLRRPGGLLITPTAITASELTPESLVELDDDGIYLGNPPSSEWRIHRDIYRSDSEAEAIVHTHSPWATALSSLRQDLPAIHYTIAMAGTDTIRCAKYATFGTAELSENVITAIEGARACLLASHGVVATGPTPGRALELATEIEHLCQIYLIARSAGSPVILDDREISRVADRLDRRDPPAGKSGS